MNRAGEITHIIAGDEKEIVIPGLEQYPLGKKRLRGLRLIHTHLKKEPLSQDDLNDLSLLRLDAVAAIRLSNCEQADTIQIAYLEPSGSFNKFHTEEYPLYAFKPPLPFSEFIINLEKSLAVSFADKTPTKTFAEKGILVSVTQKDQSDAQESIDELKELAHTAGIEVLDSIIQRPREFNPKYLMGEGKIREVVIRSLEKGGTMLLFDQELSPAQVNSISSITELKVIDRSQLILDIFARRAATLDGKVQVELAQLKYLLPRLSGRGIQMSRLMGGIGGRGPGETKLEIDRRRIRERIDRLERELENLSKNRLQRRQKRKRSALPIISIVGYTNAGKSTLLNRLTGSSVLTENRMFATLDTSSRRLRFPKDRDVIITDTVGFIRSLPQSLMGAFKATLEEMNDADLLIHLVDCSNRRFEKQIVQVENILEEIGLPDIPRITVFNKADALVDMKRNDTVSYMKVIVEARKVGALMVSALDRKSLDPLITELASRFWKDEQIS